MDHVVLRQFFLYLIILLYESIRFLLEEVHMSIHVYDSLFQLFPDLLSTDFETLQDAFINSYLLESFLQLYDPCFFLFIILA
jgi:hypothetical protein